MTALKLLPLISVIGLAFMERKFIKVTKLDLLFIVNNQTGYCPLSNRFPFFYGILCCGTRVEFGEPSDACPQEETSICPSVPGAVCGEIKGSNMVIPCQQITCHGSRDCQIRPWQWIFDMVNLNCCPVKGLGCFFIRQNLLNSRFVVIDLKEEKRQHIHNPSWGYNVTYLVTLSL